MEMKVMEIGTRIQKIRGESADVNEVGALGRIIGAISCGFPVVIDGQTIHCAYYVAWQGGGPPTMVCDWKVERYKCPICKEYDCDGDCET